jgi:hypothetical protein
LNSDNIRHIDARMWARARYCRFEIAAPRACPTTPRSIAAQ